ncbi:hypothetical protein [Nonomuraea sp. NEAU-A123]|uniref:hypothetical protein n=1 Tax=Nonomuraea sp. NEAU-A123 TaxID=2839649 RepID=UPI001BE3DFD9|nr:hypothetical protein [Nonomuraea sp. NEAU-A123]MBT2230049.1 hypothetical protein [Nonomuraea sp. NEAU-A123]MBT2230681.1 hypothetical protein [Nonomuraea sp. NEAU-A123]
MTTVGHGSEAKPIRLISPERRRLMEMIKTLARLTGKPSIEAQASALGISRSTLHRWINGDLPQESNYGDLLKNARLSTTEQQAYWKVFKAAAASPAITLLAEPDSAIVQAPPAPDLNHHAVSSTPLEEQPLMKTALPNPEPLPCGASPAQPFSLHGYSHPMPGPPTPAPTAQPAPPRRRRMVVVVAVASVAGAMVVAACIRLVYDGFPGTAHLSSPPVASSLPSLGRAPDSVEPTPDADHCDRYQVTARDMSLRNQDNVRTGDVLKTGEIATVTRRGTPTGRTQLWYVITDRDHQGWVYADHRYWSPHC